MALSAHSEGNNRVRVGTWGCDRKVLSRPMNLDGVCGVSSFVHADIQGNGVLHGKRYVSARWQTVGRFSSH